MSLSLRRHPHLYELNAWAWLEELSERHGRRLTLGTVPEEEWDGVARAGFDLVWLMGIWERSPAARRLARTDPSLFPRFDEARPGWTLADVAGSPYAVRAYEPDPNLGDWAQLDEARGRLRSRGVGLILDFVGNHTALDHSWAETHPEHYVQGRLEDFRREPRAFHLRDDAAQTPLLAHGRDPFFPPWTDTLQINYRQPAARAAMLEELRRIAAHCDGVRCDMAMLLLNDVFTRTWGTLVAGLDPPPREFWAEVEEALPGLLKIAEVYWGLEPSLRGLGFDYTYDKTFYDHLRADRAREAGRELTASAADQGSHVRFLENHDEERAAAAFGPERLPAAATLVATLPGVRFYHQGQLEGRVARLPIQLSACAPRPADAAVRDLYERLLLVSDEAVFHDGEWRLLEVRPAGDDSHEQLIAYRWRLGNVVRIVVAHPAPGPAQGRVMMEEDARPGPQALVDLLDLTRYVRDGGEIQRDGLYVKLAGHRAHLFEVTGESA